MLLTPEEIEAYFPQGIDLDIHLAGGISTLQSGFQIGYVTDSPILCFLMDADGNAFARFDRDQTVKVSQCLSIAESEAIEGLKRLVLRW